MSAGLSGISPTTRWIASRLAAIHF